MLYDETVVSNAKNALERLKNHHEREAVSTQTAVRNWQKTTKLAVVITIYKHSPSGKSHKRQLYCAAKMKHLKTIATEVTESLLMLLRGAYLQLRPVSVNSCWHSWIYSCKKRKYHIEILFRMWCGNGSWSKLSLFNWAVHSRVL